MTKTHIDYPRCYIDANVLVSYLWGMSIFYEKSVSTIEKLVEENYRIFISSLVLDETINTFRKLKAETEETKREVCRVCKRLKIKIINPKNSLEKNLDVFEVMQNYALSPRDAFHVLICLHNQIPYFATFDTDYDPIFKKKLLKVV